MKPKCKTITVAAILSVVLFMIAYGITLLPTLTGNYRPLLNTLGFAMLLYAWAILGIWRKRRFAVGFMQFINVVYSFGFISTLISGENLVTIIESIIGLMVNGYLFWVCHQSAQQLRSQGTR